MIYPNRKFFFFAVIAVAIGLMISGYSADAAVTSKPKPVQKPANGVITATLDGRPWSGSISGTVTTKCGLLDAPFKTEVPVKVPDIPIDCSPVTLTYVYGGPSGANFTGIKPSPTQYLSPGKTVTFVYEFENAKDDSQFGDWQPPPAVMQPGEEAKVWLVWGNTGNEPWTRGSYYLLSQNPEGNKTWGISRVDLPQDRVDPGQKVSFVFNVVAPSQTGQYHFQWRMAGPNGAFGGYAPDAVISVSPKTGTVEIAATLDGQPWSGSLKGKVEAPCASGPFTATLPMKIPDVPVTCSPGTFYYVSGGPPDSAFVDITPSATQSVKAGGLTTFTYNFKSVHQKTSTIKLDAVLDKSSWAGTIRGIVKGSCIPDTPFEVSVPVTIPDIPSNCTWATFEYSSGGPPNSKFVEILPLATQDLTPGETYAFIFSFSSNVIQPPPILSSVYPSMITTGQTYVFTFTGLFFQPGAVMVYIGQAGKGEIALEYISRNELRLNTYVDTAFPTGPYVVVIKNPDGGVSDGLQMIVTARGTNTIQGYKVPNTDPTVSGQTVMLDNKTNLTSENPYFFRNVSPGRHYISVSVPPGWSVGYTLCYNDTSCHNMNPVTGNSVVIELWGGDYVDLWWHYTKAPLPPPTLRSVWPVPIIAGQTNVLTFDGIGFQSGAVMIYSGPTGKKGDIALEYISSNQLRMNAYIDPAAFPAGTYIVAIRNPDGGESNGIQVPVIVRGTSTIQGYKVPTTDPTVSAEIVTLDYGIFSTATNPYFFRNVSAGIHNISVTVPPGWQVGYTVCYNDTSCHNRSPASGSSVAIELSGGDYADLWWHYTPVPVQAPTPAPETLTLSASAGCAAVSLSWNSITGAGAYEVYRNNAKLASLPGSANRYQDSSISPGSQYDYYVRASVSGGWIVSNTVSVRIRQECYEEPTPF